MVQIRQQCPAAARGTLRADLQVERAAPPRDDLAALSSQGDPSEGRACAPRTERRARPVEKVTAGPPRRARSG